MDDPLHGFLVGEADVVEETAAQKSVGQFFLVVAGNDDDRPVPGLDRLLGLVDMEFHPVEFEQQVVGKLDVGLVDLIDQHHRLHLVGERLPQLALDDVVADVVDPRIAQLRIAQPRHRVVLVQALLCLGGGLDVPLNERSVQGEGDFLGQLGLASARFAFDQQRPAQGHGGVHRHHQIVGGDIAVGTAKTGWEHGNVVSCGAAAQSGWVSISIVGQHGHLRKFPTMVNAPAIAMAPIQH